MTEPIPSLKAPRGGRQRQRTRSALISAGQALFAARAVDSVTVDEIVDEAEVAKGSFYNHFNDKEALADAVYDLVQSDVEAQIVAANHHIDDAPFRIARALCTVIRYALDHPERLQALLSLDEQRSNVDSPLNTGVSADVRQGIDQGALRWVTSETGVLMVVGTIGSAVRHAMSGASHIPPPDLAEALAAALLRALGVDPERAQTLGKQAARELLA